MNYFFNITFFNIISIAVNWIQFRAAKIRKYDTMCILFNSLNKNTPTEDMHNNSILNNGHILLFFQISVKS